MVLAQVGLGNTTSQSLLPQATDLSVSQDHYWTNVLTMLSKFYWVSNYNTIQDKTTRSAVRNRLTLNICLAFLKTYISTSVCHVNCWLIVTILVIASWYIFILSFCWLQMDFYLRVSIMTVLCNVNWKVHGTLTPQQFEAFFINLETCNFNSKMCDSPAFYNTTDEKLEELHQINCVFEESFDGTPGHYVACHPRYKTAAWYRDNCLRNGKFIGSSGSNI